MSGKARCAKKLTTSSAATPKSRTPIAVISFRHQSLARSQSW